MRVIRTELYFSGSDLKRIGGSRLKSTNVSFAWLNDADVEAPELGRHPAIRPEQVPSVIDHILRQEPLTDKAWIDEGRILNEAMVYGVMRSEIVIEQSPPEWETLANILRGIKGGGTVAVSLLIAWKGDPLLFIKVASGMLLIGAATGTSKWLQQNIPKMLSKATRRLLR
jgi:hypothetical protein